MATVLGIDTATADAVVAVTRDGRVVDERTVGPGGGGRPRHSAALLGEIEAAVEGFGGWDGFGLIAVGIGPGSYTGLRIGIATARALAQALELPIVGVPSLAALARAIGQHPEAAGRPRLAAIDARRGELFASLNDASGGELWGPLVLGPEELDARLASVHEPALAAGDGAVRFRHELEAAGASVPADGDPVHRIAARHICGLAETLTPSRPDQIQPLYLRAPDAEIWIERDGS